MADHSPDEPLKPKAAHGVDNATKLEHRASQVRFTKAPLRAATVGSIRSLRSARKPRLSTILVRAGHPAKSDGVGSEDRGEFPGFGHRAPFYIQIAE